MPGGPSVVRGVFMHKRRRRENQSQKEKRRCYAAGLGAGGRGRNRRSRQPPEAVKGMETGSSSVLPTPGC